LNHGRRKVGGTEQGRGNRKKGGGGARRLAFIKIGKRKKNPAKNKTKEKAAASHQVFPIRLNKGWKRRGSLFRGKRRGGFHSKRSVFYFFHGKGKLWKRGTHRKGG